MRRHILRIVCSTVLPLLTTSVQAQGPAPSRAARAPASKTTPALAARGYLAFSVVDLDASAKWYNEKLGLRMLFYAPRTPAVDASAAFLQGGGLFVELVQVDDAADLSRRLPPAQIAEGGGRQYMHGVFKDGAVVDELDKAVATLRARGVEIVIRHVIRQKKSWVESGSASLPSE